MKQKPVFFLAGAGLAVTLLFGACSSSGSSMAASTQPVEATGVSASVSISESTAMITDDSAESTSGQTFTLEDLAMYDGKDGRPAYVAVEGVVYDVTNVPQWSGGEHNGYSAGQDLTDEIENISPHGTGVLANVPVVGTLVS